MNKYGPAIKTLLEKEAGRQRPQIYFLSLYFPTKNYSQREIKKRLKSLILGAFRSYKKLRKKTWLHHKTVEKVNKKIISLRKPKRGIAIFVKFSAKKQLKKKEIRARSRINLFSLQRAPKKEIYIGKTFDLDQLVWLDTIAVEGLVLNLTRRRGDIYILNNGNLELFSREENKFIKEKEQEYLGKYGKRKKGRVYFGTGSAKTEQRKAEENKRFLEEIRKTIKGDAALRTGLDYLLVFYSAAFSDFIDDFVQEAEGDFPGVNLLLINKSIVGENKLKKEALKRFKTERKRAVKRALEKAKSSYGRYVEGWSKVAKASRRRKIETLFIQSIAQRKGYLLKKRLVYTYPIKNSRAVRNIAPWIVRNVVQERGKIILLEKQPRKRIPPIAAKLRY